jgi:hypothetical protein
MILGFWTGGNADSRGDSDMTDLKMDKPINDSFATGGLATFMNSIHPEIGMTVKEYAYHLFMWQMEYYSAHAMTDLPKDMDIFLSLPKKTQQGWYNIAKQRMKDFQEKKT